MSRIGKMANLAGRAARRLRTAHGLTALAIACACVAACDTADDPPPQSTFVRERRFTRTAQGRVVSDLDPVGDALVRVDPSPLSGVDAVFDPALTVAFPTPPSGTYFFETAPARYDLSVLHGRDLFAFKDVYFRYFEPQIGGDLGRPAFFSTVRPIPDVAVGEAMAIAYFASGTDVISLDDRGSEGLVIGSQRYDAEVTLHAVIYPVEAGVQHATAYGQATAHLQTDQAQALAVHLEPIAAEEVVTTFAAQGPAGTTIDAFELYVDFGARRVRRSLGRVRLGEALSTARIPFARWSYRAHGVVEGGETDSGQVFFDPALETNTVVLYPPPLPDVARGDVLSAVGTGMFEHVLVPESADGPTLHVFSMSALTSMPDAARYGLPAPAGAYRWTVRTWPRAVNIGAASGTEARLQPSAVSAPRAIVLP